MKESFFAGLVILAATSTFGQIVFQDTFDRPDNLNPGTIDTNVTGITSSLFTPTAGNVYISGIRGNQSLLH